MPALERLYTIAPSFRAEKSRTRRHLTEFWHAEMEIAWADNNDVMDHGEALVRHIARTLLTERPAELESLGGISRSSGDSQIRITPESGMTRPWSGLSPREWR